MDEPVWMDDEPVELVRTSWKRWFAWHPVWLDDAPRPWHWVPRWLVWVGRRWEPWSFMDPGDWVHVSWREAVRQKLLGLE